jgi:hypothetical protein
MNQNSVKKHYENLLADSYSWMFGDFDQQVSANRQWFQNHDIFPFSMVKPLILVVDLDFNHLRSHH